MTILTASIRHTIAIVLPAKCVGCGSRGSYFCDACVEATPRANPTTLSHDGYAFDSATSVFNYEGAARKAVHHLKFRHLRALAEPMGLLVANAIPSDSVLDAIVPVPLHRSRLRERGYNQSELLAKHIGRLRSLPILPTLLARTTQRGTQVEARGAAARQANVRNAFDASPAADGLRIALVDDVMTTGSTLDAAARTLIRAGAHEVHAYTFAREA